MKNFFKYRGTISRIGFILILIGVFLSGISFIKGIQILMFIPALVISLFLYSFFEVKKLKNYIKCTLIKEGENYIVNIKSDNNINFFLRIGYKKGNNIILLNPNYTNNYFNVPYDEDIEIIVFMKGTFDILRNVINIGKINQNQISKIKISNSQEYKNNTFFFVREYESGDNLNRIDSIKSALKNIPFIKTIVNFDISKFRGNDNNIVSKLFVTSNKLISAKNDIMKGNILKWILICVNFIVIYIEWESIVLNAFILFPAIPVIVNIYYKKYIFKNLKILNLIIFLLFVNMIVMTFLMRDMTGPGSVFLTQILIFKQLFFDEREDGFLYIFLSLFVFVAVSLFSIELWFILFFILYLIISVFLLTSVSGYMLTDPVKGAIGTNNSKFNLFKTILSIFVSMIILFFVLPHGNKQESGASIITPQNTETISGFSNELNFNNITNISRDTSKVIVVDNLGEDRKNLLKKSYWRGERFYIFRNNAWIKSNAKKTYLLSKKDNITSEDISISYLSKGITNIFFPAVPKDISFGDTKVNNFLRLNMFDNSIFYLASKNTKPINLIISFEKDTNGNLLDANIKYNYSYSGSKIDKNTKKLFSKFWDKIDKIKYNTPEKLTSYIKNKYGFEYSIDDIAKSLEDFLYGSKKGYCEYYATVLALTLQHFGYNATVVNGYYSGEWNDLAKSWIIRGKDAHSWVEIYNGTSWQIYDATPNIFDLGSLPFYIEVWNYFVSVYDYLDLKWYTYIVNYSGDVQLNLLAQILHLKYQIISILLLISLLFILKYLISIFLLNRTISYEEKLLKYLKKITKNSFPLSYLIGINKSLVEETREMIYKKNRLSKKDYINLKSCWKKVFSNNT